MNEARLQIVYITTVSCDINSVSSLISTEDRRSVDLFYILINYYSSVYCLSKMFCELPQFARCCFCMPLRRGVLTFGYLNIIFSMFMLGVYSYSVHNGFGVELVYRGVSTSAEAEICIAIYCVDILFNVLMVYGAHKQIESCLKIFYYYTLSMTIAVVIIEIVTIIDMGFFYQIEMITFFLVGLCIHLYLLFLVRSLIQKMNDSGRAYENQLHQFVNGELKLGGGGIYPSTVIPVERV